MKNKDLLRVDGGITVGPEARSSQYNPNGMPTKHVTLQAFMKKSDKNLKELKTGEAIVTRKAMGQT